MMQFATITEHDILSLAVGRLYERLAIEEERLQARPSSLISKNLIEKYNCQIDELNARVLEIEATERKA